MLINKRFDIKPDLIQKLAENEEALSLLYEEYAKTFSSHRDLWSKLAHEEKEHANWIRELYSNREDNALVINGDRFNRQAIQTFLNYMQRELEIVKKGKAILINALSVALYIEESLIEQLMLMI